MSFSPAAVQEIQSLTESETNKKKTFGKQKQRYNLAQTHIIADSNQCK